MDAVVDAELAVVVAGDDCEADDVGADVGGVADMAAGLRTRVMLMPPGICPPRLDIGTGTTLICTG